MQQTVVNMTWLVPGGIALALGIIFGLLSLGLVEFVESKGGRLIKYVGMIGFGLFMLTSAGVISFVFPNVKNVILPSLAGLIVGAVLVLVSVVMSTQKNAAGEEVSRGLGTAVGIVVAVLLVGVFLTLFLASQPVPVPTTGLGQ